MDGGGVGYEVERGRDGQSAKRLRSLVCDAVEELELNDVEERRVLGDRCDDVVAEEETLVRREVIVDGEAGLGAETSDDRVGKEHVHVRTVVDRRQADLIFV